MANITFGERDAPIVFGWVVVGHQIGAATVALGAGAIREFTSTHTSAFLIAGAFGLVAAVAVLAARVQRPDQAFTYTHARVPETSGVSIRR